MQEAQNNMFVFLSFCLVVIVTFISTYLTLVLFKKSGVKKLKCGNKFFHISITFITKRRTKKE